MKGTVTVCLDIYVLSLLWLSMQALGTAMVTAGRNCRQVHDVMMHHHTCLMKVVVTYAMIIDQEILPCTKFPGKNPESR